MFLPKSGTTVDPGSTPEATKDADSFEEIGAELAQDAKIWGSYVQQTDRADREMIEGWHSSMDVLLIFAALFSAITTAMVIESSKQLQQDPAEAAAQTLLVMSQTLIALSNNEPTLTPNLPTLESNFSASRLSVVINALWYTSLSLSIAVSLIAMLSKGWCHTFMSGRSGTRYEQARQRQQRWDSLETWKMKRVLTQLPLLMHCALACFALGLCIHLWSVNAQVALPTIIVMAIFLGLYLIVTVLPLVYPLCPYSTPLSSICLGAIHSVKPA
ncbi:hypothetical protein BDV93DRAFT_462324, partial [Ceratobasidium sp. AG-I]